MGGEKGGGGRAGPAYGGGLWSTSTTGGGAKIKVVGRRRAWSRARLGERQSGSFEEDQEQRARRGKSLGGSRAAGGGQGWFKVSLDVEEAAMWEGVKEAFAGILKSRLGRKTAGSRRGSTTLGAGRGSWSLTLGGGGCPRGRLDQNASRTRTRLREWTGFSFFQKAKELQRQRMEGS